VADYSKTVEVIFGAVDNLSGTVSKIGSGISELSGNLEGALKPLDNLAGGVKLVDTAIVGLGLALGGVAVVKAGEFGAQINEVGTLFGASSENLDKLSGSVLTYAQKSTASISDLNGAIYTAVSAGVDWEKSIDFISTAEKLSVAGKADLNSTTLALVGTMNAYGASTEEAGKYSDLFMKTVALGQTTLPELAASLSQVTATASAAGIPFEEVTAAVSALTAAGTPTSVAMTQIKAAISGIVKPTGEARDAAAELGIGFDANALAGKGLSGVFADIFDKTGGNITQISKLFGSVEALQAALSLGRDASGKYAGALEGMQNAAGTTDAAFKLLEGTFANVNQGFKNSLDILLIEIGKQLLPGYQDIVKDLQGVTNAVTFSLNEGAFDEVFAALGRMGKDVSDFLKDVAKALPEALDKVDFGKFAAAMENLAGSFAGIFDGIDLRTPEGLAKAIQLVVDSGATFLNMGAGIAQSWGEALDKIMPLIEGFAGMSKETAEASGKVLGYADVLSAALPLIGSMGNALDALGLAMNAIAAKSVVDLVKGFVDIDKVVPKVLSGVGGLAVALGPTALVGAAGAAGYAVGTVLNEGLSFVIKKLTGSDDLGSLIYDLVHANDDLAESAPPAAEGVKKVGSEAEKSADGVGKAAQANADLAETTKKSKEEIDGQVNALMKVGLEAGYAKKQAEFLAAAQKAIKEPTEENTRAMAEAAGEFNRTAQAAGKLEEASKVLATEYGKLKEKQEPTTKELKNSGDVMDELAKKTDLTNKELIELAKVTKEAEFKLEQLASNERIKFIEARVQLNVAQIQAQTEQVKAAFGSIDETIKSTGDVISTLFQQWEKGDWSSKGRAIEEQLEKENEARQKAFELQEKATEAIIRNLDAQTARLGAADPMITINGDGLKPHLEAFMWEILGAIQTRVNQDGLDLLMGFQTPGGTPT
jgi:TP901 family phage tail tape measure protein